MKWALLVVFAVLPIQWVLVPTHVIGQQRLHILALILFTVVAMVRYSRSAFAAYARVTWPFLVGMGAITLLWLAANEFHAQSLRDPVQQIVQLLIFVVLGTALSVTLRNAKGAATLRWVGPVCNLVLVAGLTVSMLVNHINPVEVVSETIASGDPSFLENRLFKGALVGFGYEADDLLSNIRHEIFAGVLTSACLSVMAMRIRPFTSRTAAFIGRFSLGLSFALILISLSRSVTIAAAVWPVLSLLRSWRLRHFSAGQIAATGFAALAVGVATAAGFTGVIVTRFTADTESYDKRGSLLDEAFANIQSHAWTGGVVTQHASSHNFVLDTWLRIGLVGAIAAALVSVALVTLFATLVVRLPVEPSWMVPVATTLALVVVRLFTAGGGSIPPVEWVALSVVGAGMCHWRWQREHRSVGEKGPAAPPAPSPTPVTVSGGHLR